MTIFPTDPPRRRRAPFIAAAPAALVVLLAPALSSADDPQDRAAAEAAFRDGLALLARGDVAAACPKLEAAVALTGGEALGGKLELARCWEKSGRLASAWALFLEVAARAQAAGQTARAADARAAADAIAPRVPRIEIVLGDEVADLPDLELARGGAVVPRAAWAAGLPVDPGTIELTLRAGDRSAVKRVTVAEGERQAVRFESLGPAPRASAPPSPAAPARSVPPVPASAPADGDAGDGHRIAAVVLGGAGIAALGVGTVLAVVARSDYDAAYDAERCAEVGGALQCDDVTAIDDARGLGTVATIVGGVGLGLVAAGVVTYLVAPDGAASSALAPRLDVGPRGAVASWGGRF